MQLPTIEELEQNLRETLVVKAEALMLIVGGDLGLNMASQLIGVELIKGTLPTDEFAGDTIQAVQIKHCEIYNIVLGLRGLLEAKSLNHGPNSDDMDKDFIEQEYLDFLELHLSSLPEMTLGGYDWSSCRNGALRQLLLSGQAWQRLIATVDEGTLGDFDCEQITATDLALITGMEIRSVRNLVGPSNRLRSQEQDKLRKTKVSERSFASINRFDALDWLVQRKDFAFLPVRAGLVSGRLGTIVDPIDRARAALIAGHVLGYSQKDLAMQMGIMQQHLCDIGDGIADGEVRDAVVEHVIKLDKARLG